MLDVYRRTSLWIRCTLTVLLLATIAVADGDPTPERAGKYDKESFLTDEKAEELAGHAAADELTTGSGARMYEAAEDTDVLHYELDIEITDIDTSNHDCTITGSNRMTIRSESAALTEFTFRLREQYTITGSFVNDVTPVTVSTESSTTRVATLDRAYGIGEEFTLTIEYTGTTVSMGFGSIDVTTQIGGAPVVSSLSQPYYAYTWWPSKDDDVNTPGDKSDKATLEFSITVPGNLTVPSNGLLQSVDALSGGRARFNWATDYPIASYLVSFAATEYNTWTIDYTHPGGTMPIQFFIYQWNDTPANRAAWERVTDMLDVYTSLYGEYPFIDEKYGIYFFPYGGGMEHQTMTGQGSFDEILTAHELSHQWWGDMITCKTWSDIWLNEGFASYSECLWKEFESGTSDPAAYFARIQARKPTNVNGSVYIPEEQLAFARILNTNFSYNKAAWVLHQLRHLVGDGVFFDILADYRAAYAFSAATTDDFVAVASAAYGSDLTWFFDQWVYQIGAPAYEFGWTTSTTDDRQALLIQVRQVQDPSYPEVFVSPIEFAATIDGSPQTITVWNDQRDQGFSVPVTGEVTELELDPDEWILRTSVVEVPLELNAPLPAEAPYDVPCNRYLSFLPNNNDYVAFQVEMTSSTHFPGSTGVVGWIGEPDADNIAPIVSEPRYADDWPALVHVADCEVVPAATYSIRSTIDAVFFSDPAELTTVEEPTPKKWADVAGPFTGTEWDVPNGVVSMDDIMGVIQYFKAAPTAPPLFWVDIDPEIPNQVVNMSDVMQVVNGFKGLAYSFSDPAACP